MAEIIIYPGERLESSSSTETLVQTHLLSEAATIGAM